MEPRTDLWLSHFLVSFQSWLGAGWPEWTVETDNDTDPTTFNADINSLFAILSLCLIAINFIAGSIVDFCRRKFATDQRPARGVGRVSKKKFVRKPNPPNTMSFVRSSVNPDENGNLKSHRIHDIVWSELNSYDCPISLSRDARCNLGLFIRYSVWSWKRFRSFMDTDLYVFIPDRTLWFHFWLYDTLSNSYLVSWLFQKSLFKDITESSISPDHENEWVQCKGQLYWFKL